MPTADARHRSLWNDWDDILASVGNYLHEYGWEPGAPVLAETVLDPDPEFTIEPHNLELNEDRWASLGAAGVATRHQRPRRPPPLLLSAEQPDGLPIVWAFTDF